jgi:hypothetical protein
VECKSERTPYPLLRDDRARQSDLASIPKMRMSDPNTRSSTQNTRIFLFRVIIASNHIRAAGTMTAQPRTYTLFEANNTHMPASAKQPMDTLRLNGSRTEPPSTQERTPKERAKPAKTVNVKSRMDQHRLFQTGTSLSRCRIAFICAPYVHSTRPETWLPLSAAFLSIF